MRPASFERRAVFFRVTDSQPESVPGWMIRPLRRYADFRGRSDRREFWWYCLFLVLGYLAIGVVGFALAMAEASDELVGFGIVGGWTLFFLANFIPGLALTTRRLHDLGMSGALLIVVFAALFILNMIGWLAYLVVMSLPGQAKTNRWGPPLGVRDVAEVFG
jgi:uncharacterized membrane protein YhaH (DUF805 family)